MAKKERDFGQDAIPAVGASAAEALKPREKNGAAVALGRLGGLKGGPRRKEVLTGERLSEIAQQAARARWAKAKG